jgi:cytochrome oxidase Cu insertion factor (SCO1/SenC/PrrC family)
MRSRGLLHNGIFVKAFAMFWSALLVVAAAMAATTQPQQARQAIDVSKLGPQVGARVPDFSLEDQNGKAWNLRSIMGRRGAMLVFFRSADW